MESFTFQHVTHDIRKERSEQIITLYGRTATGSSCAVHVKNFKPYIYIKCTMEKWERLRTIVLSAFKLITLKRRKEQGEKYGYFDGIDFYGKKYFSFQKCGPKHISVSSDTGYSIRELHDGPPESFLRVTAMNDNELRTLTTIFKNIKDEFVKAYTNVSYICSLDVEPDCTKEQLEVRDMLDNAHDQARALTAADNIATFEAMFDGASLLLIDQCVKPCGWIEVVNALNLTDGAGEACITNCDEEYATVFSTKNPTLKLATDHPPLAPLKLLSYDIEAVPDWPKFPVPEANPICTIGVVCYQFVTESMEYHVFTVGETGELTTDMDPSDDEFDPARIKVHWFTTEEDMLASFSETVRDYGPDFISGWNVNNFDNVYTMQRIDTVMKNKSQRELAKTWGRTKRSNWLCKKFKQSKQTGGKEWWEMTASGIIFFDGIDSFRTDHKLRSYKLDEVSKEFLKTQKVEMAYKDIKPMSLTRSGREKLAVYCVKDSWLPVKLCVKLSKITNAISLSNVTGAPIHAVLYRGQQIRVMNLLVRFVKEQPIRYFLPNQMITRPDDVDVQGAFVLDPVPGFYNDPVICLDFASLYPSIMCANNMCYSTILTRQEARRLNLSFDGPDPEVIAIRDFESPEGGEFKLIDKEDDVCFVQEKKRKGILPIVLQTLLAERKRYKRKKKEAKNKTQRSVYDGHQLALKICANSVYGFTGATIGYLPEPRITSSVTKRGRAMLYETKYNVEKNFAGTKVVYGDTDSVFVHLAPSLCKGNTSEELVKRAEEIGTEMGKFCTKVFRKPNDLEYEKCYLPFLLVKKKRYCGKKYEEGTVKIDTKGLESTRRDFAPLVSSTMKKMLNTLMETRDVQACKDYYRSQLAKLARGDVSLEEITMSKQITKPLKSYANPMAHVVLARRLQKELPEALAPKVGDRINYVISRHGGRLSSERAIQPHEVGKTIEIKVGNVVVQTVKLRVDWDYYIHKQMREPLMRILRLLGATDDDFFSGQGAVKRKAKKKRVKTIHDFFKFQGGNKKAKQNHQK